MATTLGEALVYEPQTSAEPVARIKIGGAAGDEAARNGGVEFVDNDTLLTWGFGEPLKTWAIVSPEQPEREYARGPAAIETALLSRADGEILLSLTNGDFEIVPLDGGDPKRYEGHAGRVLVADRNGRYLATGAIDGTVRVWDTGSDRNTPLATFYLRGAAPGSGRQDVLAVRWEPGGKLVAAGAGGTLQLWQALDGDGRPTCFGAVGAEGRFACAGGSQAYGGDPTSEVTLDDARWLGSEVVLASGDPGVARRVNLATGKATAWGGIDDGAGVVVWSPDGQYLLSYPGPDAESPGSGRVIAVDSGEVAANIDGPILRASWPSAGLLVQREPGAVVRIDPSGWQETQRFEDPGEWLAADAQPRGDRLAISDEQGAIRVWDVPSGRLYPLIQANEGAAAKLAWHAGGSRLAAAGTKVTLWDAVTGAQLWASSAEGVDVTRPAFSPDGRLVAAGIDSAVYVWRTGTDEIVWRVTPDGNSTVSGVQWLSATDWENGRQRPMLLTWTPKMAQIWDLANGRADRAFQPRQQHKSGRGQPGRRPAPDDGRGRRHAGVGPLAEPAGATQKRGCGPNGGRAAVAAR